jgi:hypothetical protein
LNTGRWFRDHLATYATDDNFTTGEVPYEIMKFENSIGSSGKDINQEEAKLERSAKIHITYGNAKMSDEPTFDSTVNEEDSNTAQYTIKLGETYNERYGDEYKFFKNIEVTDPFVYKKIKDKYDYFTPVFHSLSPEGFNARLNFLHQCTRQGHTISASEQTLYTPVAATAGNLSFGRQPVIVLKIGDFINTRAVIQSMNINYSMDGMQWDLNPEGAGVQPMFAKVSMNIVILGGMSLNAPINRLQNAHTFDYYANSGVYDNRADRVDVNLDSSGAVTSVTYKNLFEPTTSSE